MLLFRYLNDVLSLMYTKMKSASKTIKRRQSLIISARFYNNIKHILFINRITGTFPITVSRSEDSYILRWSWFKVIISSSFFVLFTIVTLTGMALSYNNLEIYNIRLKTLASKIVTSAETLTLLCTWLVGQISVPILFQEYWKYLICLKKCNDVIGAIEPTKRILSIIVVVFLFTFTCLGMDIYMWSRLAVPLMGPYSFIWKMVPFYFTYVFTMIIELNFWISVYGITVRIRKLNKLICSYVNVAESEEGNDYNNMLKSLSVMKGENKVSNVKIKSSTSQLLSSETINSFMSAYRNISEATVAVNNFFGLIIMIILLTVIVCMVITPYVLYQQIRNSKTNYFIFTQSYWMICHVLRLFLIVEPCHKAQAEGAELRKSAVKLLNLPLREHTHSKAKMFYIIVAENNIEFSAYGMTVINRSILPTIGGALFTYLAILFQYNL